MKIDPNNVDVLCNTGTSLHKLGKYIEALKCFGVALKIDAAFSPFTTKTIAWINKGIVLQDLEEHKEAVECYNRALELDPKNAHAWHHKGISLGS